MRALFVILPLSFILASCMKSKKVDMIVHNATIYTVDNEFSSAEAMAISGDSIVAIGPERKILNEFDASNIIDARKRYIYPGFIDAHCHFLGFGLSLTKVDLTGTSSFQEVVDRIVRYSKISSSEWITGHGWDQNDWEVKEFPNKRVLDSLFPNRPVLIRRVGGHAALANQAALDRAGVTVETVITGGIIEQSEEKLTGILIDKAVELVNDERPEETKEEKTQALIAAQKKCLAVGLTTVDDAGLDRDEIELMDKLHRAGVLKMKVYAMISDDPDNLQHYLAMGPVKTERLNVRSFKFYADGALGSRGACLLKPYSDVIPKDHYGLTLSPYEHYLEYAWELHEKGFQMNTHCIGDSANRMLLDIYTKVLDGTNDLRWRIEHAQMVHPDDLGKFRRSNIIPSVQPTHATSDMYWAEDRLGSDRVQSAYTYKDLHDQLGFLALGTDFPVEDISPFKTFYSAVARKDPSPLLPRGEGEGSDEIGGWQMENALSREEAIRGMTIGAAIANFEEDEKGSLEVGKCADFVILSDDLMTTPLEKVRNIRVVSTFINGEKVYPEEN